MRENKQKKEIGRERTNKKKEIEREREEIQMEQNTVENSIQNVQCTTVSVIKISIVKPRLHPTYLYNSNIRLLD